MISLERQTNDFEDDIALGYREDISIINRFGNLGNLSLKNDALVAPINIVKNTSNVYSQINAYSDSVLDDFELIVSGDAIGEFGRLANGLEMAGTSNSSTSINVFKSVDTVVNLRNLDGSTATNTGNITIQRINGQAIAYIPAQYAKISVIWNQPINDGIVNARWNPDYTIDGGHTIYGAIENIDTSFDDNDLVVEIKIVNYNILEDIP